MSTISTFKSIENKHDLCRDKDCMKKFHKSLKEHAIFVEKNLKINMPKKQCCKIWDHYCYTGEYKGTADTICNSMYSVPKEIPVVFQSRSNYGYHFNIKELLEQFKEQFTCLGKILKNA